MDEIFAALRKNIGTEISEPMLVHEMPIRFGFSGNKIAFRTT